MVKSVFLGYTFITGLVTFTWKELCSVLLAWTNTYNLRRTRWLFPLYGITEGIFG